jgi:nucleotide-binding universal stress UspA family protein
MSTETTSTRARTTNQRARISRIAVGVNGTPEGRDAARLAAAVADVTGGDLMLVSVHPAPLVPVPPDWSWESLRANAEATLRSVRDTIAPAGRIRTETDFSVPRALHRVARHHHRDLLVVGSSRQADEGHVRIGKRTRELLGQFECPLAVAPRGLAGRADVALRAIGVGYDGGAEADAALELAGALAVAAHAELRVHVVIDDRIPVLLRSPWSSLLDEEWKEVVDEEAARLEEQARAAADRTGAGSRVTVSFGRPADPLMALSREVDLIVIGSRRWGPAERVLLGSTGEALLHDAACPVLAVPRPAE